MLLSEVLWVALVGLVSVILWRWWKYLQHREMLKTMPGFLPSVIRILNPVSNYFALRKFRKPDEDLSTTFFRMRANLFKRFQNDGIYYLWIAYDGQPFVSVFRADLIEELLKSPHFATKAIGYDLLHHWLGKGLLTSNGTQWKSQRRTLTPSFHFSILDEYEATMNKHSLEVVHELKSSSPEKLKNIELGEWATDVTLAVLLETVMGLEADDPDSSYESNKDYINALNDTARLFSQRFIKPWNKIDKLYYNLPEGKSYIEAVSRLHAFTEKVINKKIKQFRADPSLMESRPGKKQSFMDMLIAMHLKGNQISIEEIKEQVATFMFAGHDTTGWAIAWTLYQLGVYEDVQEKLHGEIDDLFDGDTTRPTTSDDLKQLKYFDRVLKECQRLNGSVPFVSRKCTYDGAKLGPYRIPINSTISLSLRYLHRDPNVFPDPEKFDPDRFLPENTQGRHPYAYIPFSAGARNCIGQRFALLELKMTLINILRSFRVKSHKPLDEIQLAGELILRAKNGLHVTFEPRNNDAR